MIKAPESNEFNKGHSSFLFEELGGHLGNYIKSSNIFTLLWNFKIFFSLTQNQKASWQPKQKKGVGLE